MKRPDRDFWANPGEDTSLVKFALTAAVLVIWAIVGYLYLVLFAVAAP